MRQKSEAVNDQRDENPIAFIVVASSLRLSLIKLYFLFVVILTDCNLFNLWCVLLLNYFELTKLSGFNFTLFWSLEVHRYQFNENYFSLACTEMAKAVVY